MKMYNKYSLGKAQAIFIILLQDEMGNICKKIYVFCFLELFLVSGLGLFCLGLF